MKTISIFGSTGSVGTSAIDVICQQPESYKVEVLVAKNNYKLLAKQAKLLQPKLIVLENEKHSQNLQQLLQLDGTKCELAFGSQAITQAATINTDIFIAAIVGMAGLQSVVQACKRKTRIAIANKESLVCAGDIIMALCASSGAEILPVDSEHNAIFQLLQNKQVNDIEKIILTASGGPFWSSSINLQDVTPAQAIKHPNWQMGQKISVDSASMANKGLELIEAKHLFGVGKSKLDVIVHPQSVVHGIAQLQDGGMLMHAASSDMKLPISYCLSYPNMASLSCEKLDLSKQKQLEFYAPDFLKFPALKIAFDILDESNSSHVIYNSANEIAVENFLLGKIKFTQIAGFIANALDKITAQKISSLEDVAELDNIVKQKLLMEA